MICALVSDCCAPRAPAARPPAPPASYITEEINAFVPVYYAYSDAMWRRRGCDAAEMLRLRARLAEYVGIFREAAQLYASGALPSNDSEQVGLAVCMTKLRRVLSEPLPAAE
jgi:hypothetical protein